MSRFRFSRVGCHVVLIESKATLTTYVIRYNNDGSFTIDTRDYSTMNRISQPFNRNTDKTKSFVDSIYGKDCDAEIIPKYCNFCFNIDEVISAFTEV